MKVLYCITRSDWGGAQVHLFDLVNELLKKGEECEVIIGEQGILFDKLTNMGVKVYHLPSLVHEVQPTTDIKAIFDLYKLIKKSNPDIIHLHSTKAGWIGRIAGLLARKKVVFTAHGWCFTEGVSSSRRKIGVIIEKILAKVTHKIICVSKYDKELALKYKVSDEEQMEVVYNGVKNILNAKSTEVREDEKVKLMMVARFSDPKDQKSLIQAMPLINEKFEVDLIGEGPNLEEAKQLVKNLKLEHRINFLGQRQDVMHLLQTTDIFVLISNYEGLPISIIEAMSMELPIVASNVGGVKELVADGKNGFLFKNGAIEDLASIINSFESAQQMRKMGEESKKIYHQKFTLKECFSHTYQIYQSVIKK